MADGGITNDPETGDLIYQPSMEYDSDDSDIEITHETNIAEVLSDADASAIGVQLTEQISHDEAGRADWESMVERFISALGVGPESDPDDSEYEFSNTSDHPLLLTALTRFQAKALSALMPSPTEVVRAEPAVDVDDLEDPAVRSEATEQLEQAARRVEDFYCWYLLEAVDTYVEDTDQILHDCGLIGMGVRRIVVDRTYPTTPVQPMHVPLQDLILSYDTKNFKFGRIAHRYNMSTNDMVRAMQTGAFCKVDVVSGMDTDQDRITEKIDHQAGVEKPMLTDTGTHRVYDIFAYLFLPEDPHPNMFARPYVVTIHSGTNKVLAIRRNWLQNDPEEKPIEHFASYIYHPGRNAVSSLGLGALLTNLTLALRTAQRRGLDAAYIANHPMGFKSGSLGVRDDSTPFTPGELRDVDIPTGHDIRASIMLNPFQGADASLMNLYDRMENNAKELGSISTIDFSEMMKSGVAAGPALAAYDESTEFQTSVHRRLYRGHATELGIIHARMREVFGGRPIPYGDGSKQLHQDDLLNVNIVPAMKPGHVSRQRAVMEAQMLFDLSIQHDDLFNRWEAAERLLTAMGTYSPEAILVPNPEDEPPEPSDAISEYMRLMNGQPVKAGPAQNHRAHVEAHVAQLKGLQNSEIPVETGQKVAMALSSHIAEHEGLDMAVQVAAQTGIPLEQLMQGLPPELEAQVAPQIAQAVANVEAIRKPKDESDYRVEIEQIRSDTKLAVEQMQFEKERIKHAAQAEIQRMREEAETYRNTTDNYWAVEIAKMREGKPASTPEQPNPPLPNSTEAYTPKQGFNP